MRPCDEVGHYRAYFDSVVDTIERNVAHVNALYVLFTHGDKRIQSRITKYLTKREAFVLGATCTKLYRSIVLPSLQAGGVSLGPPMMKAFEFLRSIESGLPIGEGELRSAYGFYRRKGLPRLLDAIRIVDRMTDPLPDEFVVTVQRFIFGSASQSQRGFSKAFRSYLNRRHQLLASFRGYRPVGPDSPPATAELLMPPKPRGVYNMLLNRALFEKFDTDADGVLSVAELAKLVESELNVDPAESVALAQTLVGRIGHPEAHPPPAQAGIRWPSFNSWWSLIQVKWRSLLANSPPHGAGVKSRTLPPSVPNELQSRSETSRTSGSIGGRSQPAPAVNSPPSSESGRESSSAEGVMDRAVDETPSESSVMSSRSSVEENSSASSPREASHSSATSVGSSSSSEDHTSSMAATHSEADDSSDQSDGRISDKSSGSSGGSSAAGDAPSVGSSSRSQSGTDLSGAHGTETSPPSSSEHPSSRSSASPVNEGSLASSGHGSSSRRSSLPSSNERTIPGSSTSGSVVS